MKPPNPYNLAPSAALALQLEATRLIAGGVVPHGTIDELASFFAGRLPRVVRGVRVGDVALVDVRRLGGGVA